MQSLIFILLISSLSAQVTKEWRINFPAEEGKQATVTIIKGKFVRVNLQLTKLEAKAKNTSTNLQLATTSEAKLGRDLYTIDPKETSTPFIHIGVPCQSTEAEGKEATLAFKVSAENYEIPDLTVKYAKAEVKQVKFSQTSDFVGIGTYGYLKVSTHDLINFDPIHLTFTSTIGDSKFAEVKPMLIPVFNGNPADFLTEKTQYLLRGEPLQEKQEFDVKSDNACFEFPKTFSFNRAWEIHPVAEDLVIPIIKSANMTSDDLVTSMNVEMNYAVYPIEQFCVAQDTRDALVTDEQILKKTFVEHPTRLRYEWMFVSNRGIGVTRFNGLSHFHPYKMKCIFQSATIEPTMTTLSFGYSPDTDIKINLEADEINPTSSQCLTWKLGLPEGGKYDKEGFEQKMLDYCYDFFTEYSIPRNENGCLECVTRNADEVYAKQDNEVLFSMCIKSKDNCESFYAKDISAKTEELKNTLLTKEAITTVIGSDYPYTVVTIYSENDNVAPDISLLTISNFVLKIHQIEFQMVTKEEKPLECFVVSKQRSTLHMSTYEFNLNHIYIPDYNTASKTFAYPFPNEEWDERLYNFIVMCYNIPFFTGNYKHTSATVKVQFIRSKSIDSPIREKPILPLNCSLAEYLFTAECTPIPHHSFMKFENKISRIESIDAIKSFYNEPPHRREQILQGRVTDLQTGHTILGKLNSAILINDMMEINNCQMAIRYDACRKVEKRVQEDVIDFLVDILGDASIVEQLTEKVLESEVGNQIKRAVMTVFSVINNSATYTLSTTKKLVKIMKSIHDYYDKLLSFVKDDKIKNDIIKIIAQYLSNFSDIISFNEMDLLYKEIDTKTHLNSNEDVLTYMELIRNFTDKLVQSHVESELKLDKLTISIKELKKPSGNAPSLVGDINFQEHLNISFDVFAQDLIQVHVPDRELYNNFNVRKIAYVFYKDYYPLVSYKHQKLNRTKAILIKAYDGNNREVPISNLKGVNRLGITFKPDNGNKHCYHHHTGKAFENRGLVSMHNASTQELLCVSSHFSEFSSGTNELPVVKAPFPIWGYFLIGGVSILLVIAGIGATIFYVIKKKREGDDHSDIPNEALINEG